MESSGRYNNWPYCTASVTHEWSRWLPARDAALELNKLQKINWFHRENRKDCLEILDRLSGEPVVGPLRRFPGKDVYVLVDVGPFIGNVNKMKCWLWYRDDRHGEGKTPDYDEAVRGFVSPMNELREYVTSPTNTWTRQSFEDKYHLVWRSDHSEISDDSESSEDGDRPRGGSKTSSSGCGGGGGGFVFLSDLIKK